MTYSKSEIRTTIRVDRELWYEFCRETKRRGTSSCPVLETLILAYLQGMARTKDEHATVVVNLTMQHVVERPRRVAKNVVDSDTESVAMYVAKFGACYRLEPKGLMPGRIGWCRWLKLWIQGLECATCVHSGDRQ